MKRARIESKKKKNAKSLKCETVDIKTEENENDIDDEEFRHHDSNGNENSYKLEFNSYQKFHIFVGIEKKCNYILLNW